MYIYILIEDKGHELQAPSKNRTFNPEGKRLYFANIDKLAEYIFGRGAHKDNDSSYTFYDAYSCEKTNCKTLKSELENSSDNYWHTIQENESSDTEDVFNFMGCVASTNYYHILKVEAEE